MQFFYSHLNWQLAFVCAARRFLDALRCDNLQRAWHATDVNALRGCHMAKALNCWHCVEEATASVAVAAAVVACLSAAISNVIAIVCRPWQNGQMATLICFYCCSFLQTT